MILSPPLIPYSPPRVTYDLPELSETHPISVPFPTFNEDIFFSSPFEWDQLSSPADNHIKEIIQGPAVETTPAKVIDTQSNFLASVKMEAPLTPISTKNSYLTYEEKPFVGLKPSTPFPSPKSPDVQRILDGLGAYTT